MQAREFEIVEITGDIEEFVSFVRNASNVRINEYEIECLVRILESAQGEQILKTILSFVRSKIAFASGLIYKSTMLAIFSDAILAIARDLAQNATLESRAELPFSYTDKQERILVTWYFVTKLLDTKNPMICDFICDIKNRVREDS